MRRRIFSLALALSFLMLAVSAVRATSPTATVATMWTTDSGGNSKVIFDISENIYIHWKADGTVLIRIEYEDGTVYGPWLKDSEGSMEFDPSNVGYYSIYCTGAQTIMVAYGRFLVIPFMPYAGLMTMVACFAAVGTLKLRRKRTW
jgi:hypothetical protein